MAKLRRGYNQNLNGYNTLSYMGVNATNPPQVVIRNQAPTTRDSKEFYIGDFWVVPSVPAGSEEVYILVDLLQGSATWLQLNGGGGSGTVQSLTGDTGGPVFPDGAGNIDVLGGQLIQTSGAGNTLAVGIEQGLNGQIPIAATGNPTIYANLTAGDGILITNGANSVTISALNEGATVAFIGKLETPSAGITGDGTLVEMGNQTGALTTIVNNGSAFTPGNGAGTPATFTAPVDGVYLLEVATEFDVISGVQSAICLYKIVTTARTYTESFSYDIPTTGTGGLYMSAIANMEAGNTAIFSVSADTGTPNGVAVGATDTYVAGSLLNSSAANPLTVNADSGSAVEMNGEINLLGNNLITTSASSDTVVVEMTNGTNGQIPIAGGSDPVWANITSSGGSITVTNGPNTINLETSGGSGGTVVTTFDSSGTWNRNANSKYITVYIWNGGSGGGSGRRGVSASSSGGGGGGSSDTLLLSAPATFFSSSESVVIGAGGGGGAAQTTNNTNGNDGSLGGVSSLGNMRVQASAISVQPGIGGATSSGLAGTDGAFISNSLFDTSSAGSGVGRFNTGSHGSSAIAGVQIRSGGGAGGGGANSSTAFAGGTGGDIVAFDNSGTILLAGGTPGIETGTLNGGNGNNASNVEYSIFGGTGGGGGGGQRLGVSGGTGGNGGIPGGGGGGGGGSINGSSSGAGGSGARGRIIIVEYL